MSMRRISATTIAAILTLLTASCGDDDNTTAPADPGATTTTDPITTAGDVDPIVGCPSGPVFPLSALDDVPPVADAPPGVASAMRTFLDNEEGALWPQDGWRVLHDTADQVLVVHVGDDSTAAESGLSFMTLGFTGDAWQWTGASSGGECPLQFQLDDRLGVVEWQLDPDYAVPGADDTVVHVLATERACASGQPMGDRLNDPVVLADTSQVSITFSVVPPAGAQTCPSNPSLPVAVDLGEPLGERRLVDGREVGVELEDLLPPA